VRLVLDRVVHRPGDADAARLGQGADPGRHVHSVAEDPIAFDRHVPEMDADPQRELRVALQRGLDREGAVHGIEGAGEDREGLVALLLDPVPVVARDQVANQRLVAGPHTTSGGLVAAHQIRVAHDVREQDGSELPLQGGLRASFWHAPG